MMCHVWTSGRHPTNLYSTEPTVYFSFCLAIYVDQSEEMTFIASTLIFTPYFKRRIGSRGKLAEWSGGTGVMKRKGRRGKYSNFIEYFYMENYARDRLFSNPLENSSTVARNAIIKRTLVQTRNILTVESFASLSTETFTGTVQEFSENLIKNSHIPTVAVGQTWKHTKTLANN